MALCAYCKSEMNEGATVCHACGRKQPLTRETKGSIAVTGIMGVFVLVALGAFGWVAYDTHAKDAAAERIAACGRLHGQPEVAANPSAIQYELENPPGNVSWRLYAKVLAQGYGCNWP